MERRDYDGPWDIDYPDSDDNPPPKDIGYSIPTIQGEDEMETEPVTTVPPEEEVKPKSEAKPAVVSSTPSSWGRGGNQGRAYDKD